MSLIKINHSKHDWFSYSIVDGKFIQFNFDDQKIINCLEYEPDLFVRELLFTIKDKERHFLEYNLFVSYEKRTIPYSLTNKMSLEEFDLIIHWCSMYLEFDYGLERLFEYSNFVINNKNNWRKDLIKYLNKQKKNNFIKKRRQEFSKNRDKLMLLIIKRDGYFCQFCKTTNNLQVDHKHPLSKGGTDELNNLQLLCSSCNARKCDKH